MEDFCLRMLEATGSQGIRSGDLPPVFPTTTAHSDPQPHMRGACDTQAPTTNAATCGGLIVSSQHAANTITVSQEERIFNFEEHPAGTLSEASPSSSSGTIGISTTLVVRSIPSRYTKKKLLQEWPVDGTFDLLYAPFNFKRKRAAGYAILNFTSSTAASAFRAQRHGRPLCAQVSSAKLSICVTKEQGLKRIVRYMIKNRYERIKNPKYLPSVFDWLREVPFSEYVEQLQQNYQSASAQQTIAAEHG